MQQILPNATLLYKTGKQTTDARYGGEAMNINLQQIKKAKSGDAEAFSKLYNDIYLDLYRFALYTLKNPADAEDAVSETVIDAFVSIKKLRSEASFKAWIFKILAVKCKRCFLQGQKQAKELPEEIAGEDETCALEEKIDLRDQFFKLKDEERLIISMHVFAGYTSREIAKILHINENTVRSKESRALKRLSRQLEVL